MGEKLKKLDKKVLLFTLIGVFAGIVLFAGSASTLKATDTGEFCSSCHIMDSVYETFANSNHASLTCNDCHLPHDSTVNKLVEKAKAGMSHMYMNTLGASKIPDVLHAKENSKEIINTNCIRCHEPSLDNIQHDVKDSCVDCHRQVPHEKGDYRPAEWHEPKEFFLQEPMRK